MQRKQSELSASEKKIMELEHEGGRMLMAKDADQIAERLLVEDALLFPPGMDILLGK